MQSIQRLAAFAAVLLACVVWASPAHADEDFREIVRQEIAAYMAEQKAKESEKKEEKKKDDGNIFKVYWKDGLRLDTKDKSVKLKIGGRVQFDGWTFSDDDYEDVTGVEIVDGVEFRRLRFYNSGQIGNHVKFKLQVDFANGPDEFEVKDAYIDLVNLKDCFGCAFPDIQFGRFKAPFSLEELTSSKYITFMERSLPNAFAPARLSGFQLHQEWLGDQLNVRIGAFAEGSGDGSDGRWENDGWGIAARVAWTPWWDCDCKCNRWQIGGSIWTRQDLDTLRFRSRPGAHGPSYRPVDTRTAAGVDFAADDALHYGLETVFTYGPWSVQAEYIAADVSTPTGDDPTFTSWYAYVSYFITGECRPLKNSQMSRVKPCCNWLDEDCCCKGGWEVALRADAIDLTDGNVDGGEMMTYTLGVNWYLNPNTRVMFNTILADVDRGKNAAGQTIAVNESILGFGMRIQVDW